MSPSKWFCGLFGIVAFMAFAVEASAQRPGGRPIGGRPGFNLLLQAFDVNRDQILGKNEVPARIWLQINKSDTNGDYQVTRLEYNSYKPR